MRCSAYCTAYGYLLKPLTASVKNRYVTTTYHRDMVHLQLMSDGDCRDVFIFSFGAFVCWGMEPDEERQILKEVLDFGQHPLEKIEDDIFSVQFGGSPKVVHDELTLPDQGMLTRLAASHALAQSVKLGAFEVTIQKAIDSVKYIPEQLASKGKIPLSRKEIRQKRGALFIERNSINLYFDVLDIPEFFWEHAELEPIYTMTANYVDIKDRVRALNQRLDIVHELFDMLGNELDNQHSSRLEWTIIWLIVCEVVIAVARDVFHWL